MHKHYKKITLIATIVASMAVIFLFAAPVYAQEFSWKFISFLPECSWGGYPGDPAHEGGRTAYNLSAVIELMVNVMRFIFSITGTVALVAFIWGGFQMLISFGNPATVTKGKETIRNAVIGLLLIFGSWMIVNFTIATFTQVAGSPAQKALDGIRMWEYGTEFCTVLPEHEVADFKPVDSNQLYARLGGTEARACDGTRDLRYTPDYVATPALNTCEKFCKNDFAKQTTSTERKGFIRAEGPKTDTKGAYCCCYYQVRLEDSGCGKPGDAPCFAKDYCEESDNKCHLRKGLGQRCRSAKDECNRSARLECTQGGGDESTYKCQTCGGDGAMICTTTPPCNTGLTAEGDGRCHAKLPAGKCNDSQRCRDVAGRERTDQYCGGETCLPKKISKELCNDTTGKECLSGVCERITLIGEGDSGPRVSSTRFEYRCK